MDKPEYSDLYRFIVSLGIILLVLAALMPWLFLRESFDALVSTSDIAKLTPAGQSLIELRQSSALWFVRNLFWVSLAPALLGLGCLTFGIVRWQRKQRLADEMELLEKRRRELEIQQMSPQEIAQKAAEEAIEDVAEAEESAKPEEPEQQEGLRVETRRSEQAVAISKYFQIERTIITKLASCFGGAKVEPNVRVGSARIDILLRVNRAERAILEVKYLRRSSYPERRRREMVEVLSNAIRSYNALAPGRKAYGIGFLVIGDEAAQGLKLANSPAVMERIVDGNIPIRIVTIGETDFMNLECSALQLFVQKGLSPDTVAGEYYDLQ